MWNLAQHAASKAKPTKQDRQRRQFLNRLIASDTVDAANAAWPDARVGRAAPQPLPLAQLAPVNVGQRPGTERPMRKGVALPLTRTARCAEVLRRGRRQLGVVVRRWVTDLQQNRMQHVRGAGLSFGLALSACLTTMGVMFLTQTGDVTGLAYAHAVLSTRPDTTATGRPQVTELRAAGFERTAAAAAVFPITLPTGHGATAALPFQPVFENAKDALGMVVFRDMPEGVALTRGAATARDIWVMAAGALGEAGIIVHAMAPQNFKVGVDLTDSGGAIYASFILDVTRASTAAVMPVRSALAQMNRAP